MEILKVKLLKPYAKLPTYAHPPTRTCVGEDAAFDIYSCEDKTLYPQARHKFMVGIASEFPKEYFLKIEGKSGLAANFGILVLGGVIDSGYRNEWGIILFNSGDLPIRILIGEKIAQGILLPKPHFVIKVTDMLAPSARGKRGWGSTGR